PRRKRWGGPPLEVLQQPGFQAIGTQPALGLAFAPRGAVHLASVVMRDVPELGIAVGVADPPPVAPAPAPTPAPTAPSPDGAKRKIGCSCATGDASGGLVLVAWL